MKARVLLVSLASFIAATIAPRTASAHAHLTKSVPAADARVPVLPLMIRLWYSEAPELALTRVTLTDSLGRAVNVGGVVRDESTLAVHVTILGKLATGRYKVTWKTAAADGHPSQGSFTFVVLPEAMHAVVTPAGPATTQQEPAPADEPTAETPPYIATRTLTFCALLIVIGVVAFRFLVLERSAITEAHKSAIRIRAASLGAIAAVGLCGLALARLYLQAAMMADASDSAKSMLIITLTQTRWGDAWLLQVIAAVAALIGFVLAKRGASGGWSLTAVAAMTLSATSALAGHAIASGKLPAIAIVVDSLHVLSAGGWLGSLFCMVSVGLLSANAEAAFQWENARALIKAFSPTALGFAAIALVTGAASAWLRLGSLQALQASMYGNVLLIKLGILSGVVGTGLYNWRRVRPALDSAQGAGRLKRSATVELVVALFVLIVTAVLVATPTPADAG
jgi:putative copper export protein/methionine-rich copper-binding protein CopC